MKKKDLASSAPWRGEEEPEKFDDAKLKVTNRPGETSTMHVPRKRSVSSKSDLSDEPEIDPELRYSFHRNAQDLHGCFQSLFFWGVSLGFHMNSIQNLFLRRVFSIDTLVKPLPPTMQYNVSRNLSFFTRIFTQFFDPEGISNAQKSLGLGQEEKARRVG